MFTFCIVGSRWSYVQSSAVRIGDETLEIVGDNAEDWLYINGKHFALEEEDKWFMIKFSEYFVRVRQSGNTRQAKIYLGGGGLLTMKTYKGFVRVDVSALGNENYDGSLGLLGRFPDGQRVGRDGVTFIEDVNAFGQEWQVQANEPQLFHTYEGEFIVQASQQCAMPIETAAKQQLRRRRLAESTLTVDSIEKACAHLESAEERKACEFDVVSTQDIDMAAVW